MFPAIYYSRIVTWHRLLNHYNLTICLFQGKSTDAATRAAAQPPRGASSEHRPINIRPTQHMDLDADDQDDLRQSDVAEPNTIGLKKGRRGRRDGTFY